MFEQSESYLSNWLISLNIGSWSVNFAIVLGITLLLQLIWRSFAKRTEKITAKTGWNIHRLVPLYLGGDNKASNTVVVHPYCHNSIHRGQNTAAPSYMAL